LYSRVPAETFCGFGARLDASCFPRLAVPLRVIVDESAMTHAACELLRPGRQSLGRGLGLKGRGLAGAADVATALYLRQHKIDRKPGCQERDTFEAEAPELEEELGDQKR
jgi:hypothetical protein